MRKFLTAFALIALSVASAATYNVSLLEPSVVQGKALKTGDYTLNVKENSVVILKNNKPQVEVPVKVVDTNRKYEHTRVLYNVEKGNFVMQEIELGGTTTKLSFDSGVQTGGGE